MSSKDFRAPPKFVLLEPSISGLQGHWVGYAVALAGEVRRRGGTLSVWVNRDIPQDAVAALEAEGVHIVRVFGPWVYNGPNVRALRWLREGVRFLLGWRRGMRLLEEQETPTFCMLGGKPSFLTAAALRGDRGDASLLMQFFEWDNASCREQKVLMNQLHAIAVQVGRHAHRRGSLQIAGQSNAVAEEIQQVFGLPVATLPMVVDWSSFPTIQPLGQVPTAGFLGTLQERRGAPQLLDALPRVRRDARWVFGVTALAEHTSQATQSTLTRLRSYCDAQVSLGPFSAQEYRRLLSQVDILALPYNPESYANKTSGMFAEAVGLERIVVVPAGTWMARIVQQHHIGVVYDSYDPTGLAEGLDEAIENAAALRARLASFAPRWRQQNCAASFIDAVQAISANDRRSA